MKRTIACGLTSLLIVITCASPAAAQIAASWQRVTITPAAIAHDPQLANMQCWDLRGTMTGNWSNAGLRAVLPAGSFFYKNALGGNTKPNLVFYRTAPSLEFTSYVTAPGEFGNSGSPNIDGGFPDGPFSLGNATAQLPGTFSARWYDLVNDVPGTHQLARLTFPLGVFPNVINIADVGPTGPYSHIAQSMPAATAEVPDIPEPASLSLASVALVLTFHRPKRAGVPVG